MKFITSDKDIFGKWSECSDNFEKVIYSYMDKNYRIYDADVCGEEKVTFLFKNENDEIIKKAIATYGWYINYDPEWELVDYIEYEYLDLNDLSFDRSPIERDWLKV